MNAEDDSIDAAVSAEMAKIAQQIGHVAIERGQLANDLGMDADALIQGETGRRWYALAQILKETRYPWTPAEPARAEGLTWGEKGPLTVMEILRRLTEEQKVGVTCLVCGGNTVGAWGKPGPVIDGHRTSLHVEPEACSAVLAKRLSEEVPF